MIAADVEGRTAVRLTRAERDQVKAWREVARRYRHGGCGDPQHADRGCGIICLAVYGQGAARLQFPLRPTPPRRLPADNTVVTHLICSLILSAVPT